MSKILRKPDPSTTEDHSFGTSGTTDPPEENNTVSGNGGYPVTAPKPGATTTDDDA